MTNPDRGIYQPPPEDIGVYDPAEDEEQERSRLPILIIIALLVLAAFGGVVWLAYNQGVARGRADAPRVIAAPAGPTKTSPEEAGNAPANPYSNLKIYNQAVPPEEEAQNSTEAAQPVTTLPQQQAPSPETATTQAAVPPAAPAPAPQPSAAPPKQSAKAPQAETLPAPQPMPAPVVETPAPAPAPAPATAATTSAAAGSGVLLQIGSYPDQKTANTAWNRFMAQHAATLQGYGPDIKSFDLGAKGTWYRLRVGPFADKATAKAACDRLKAEGAPACFLAAP